MYKLIRIFNKNRKKIIEIILVIVLIIGIISLLNYILKNKTDDNLIENTNKNNIYSQELLSDKSAISGGTISSNKLEQDISVIEKFINYCNESNVKSAYELLTDECKEEMFPTINDFRDIYYSKIFNDEKKIFTAENWANDTYLIRITGDILSSGKISDSTKQDYVTIVKNNGEYKLNVNNYLGRKNLNKETENKNIKVNVISKDTYMDYEIYNLSIKNNSDYDIMLGTNTDTESIYLLDSNDMKYYFYNNEIVENGLIIQSKYTNSLQIKFMNSYSSTRKIKYLMFSKLILNYDEYKNIENKLEYKNQYNFRVNI